jgi:hypothetical protein
MPLKLYCLQNCVFGQVRHTRNSRSAAPIWLVSGSTGLGPRGGGGDAGGEVREAGGGGEAGVGVFSLSGSGTSSEEAKCWGERSAVASPVSKSSTWVCCKPDLAEWLLTNLGLQRFADEPLCGFDLLSVFLLPLAGVKTSA